jgi:hypothetical protein
MSVQDLLLGYAFTALPAGLAAGLGLGLVARRDDGWGGYGAWRRRATRLGHVALVMLPLIALAYALALPAAPAGRVEARLAAWLWVAGGVLLPVALFVIAWRRRLQALVVPPALSLTAGASLFAVAWWLA